MGALAGAWLLSLLVACEPIEPCDEYVDYMCACHADDTGTGSCDELEDTYTGAGPSVQDECDLLLRDQQNADEDAGETCVAG